jgi:hypothetical protein
VSLFQNNEEAEDDADRRKTYQLANQLYSHLTTLLYADRDEFFFCSSAIKPSPAVVSLTFPHSIPMQKKIQSNFFRSFRNKKDVFGSPYLFILL